MEYSVLKFYVHIVLTRAWLQLSVPYRGSNAEQQRYYEMWD
jgi:hypothetical protein